MKSRPTRHRIRTTIKWGGAAVTVLLVVVWVASGWRCTTGYLTDGVYACISRGSVNLIWCPGIAEPSVEVSWSEGWTDFHLNAAPRWYSDDYSWRAAVPLWIPMLVAFGLTANSWRLDTLARRRARLNLCPKCSYDRTGLAKDAVCPECGAPAAHP